MCMRVALNQQKNGVLAVCCRSMKSSAAARNSSSTVSMRFVIERAGVLDGLLADPAEARILGRIVPVARLAFEHAARTEPGAELGFFG